MAIDDDFEYEEEIVLDDDLPQGFQVYESVEDYAADMEAEDEYYDDDDDDIQELLAQAYQRNYGSYD